MSLIALAEFYEKVLKDLKVFNMPLRFITTLCFLLAALNSHAYQSLDKIIAIVDNDVITESDFNRRLQQVEKNLAGQKNLPSDEEIRQEVLDRLILESLQLQMAKQAGVEVSNERLTEAMQGIAQRNNMSLPEFKKALEADGSSYYDMREQVRQDMMIKTVQQGHLRNQIKISDEEVDNFLKSAKGKQITTEQFQLSHIVLPLPSSANKQTVEQAKATLLQLRQELLQNPKQFQNYIVGKTYQGQKISGSNFGWQTSAQLPSLFAQHAKSQKAGSISQPIRSGAGWHLLYVQNKSGDQHTEFQMHARHILLQTSEVRSSKQAKALADDLRKRLENGEDFALLAKEYSDDNGSALQGGDLGWSPKGQFVPVFEKTLLALKDGEISQPFKTQFGWHIAQKLGERQHDVSQENWRNQAYQTLYERKFQEELENWQATIRNEAFIEMKE